MYRYSTATNPNLIKPVSPVLYSRETAFDPLHYSFDAETMIEPFTYFHDGPADSRRKCHDFSSIPSPTSLIHFPWSLVTSISPTEEKPKPVQQRQTPTNAYPKTICRHCKSHNMPECLYTSHTMYDENGEIFCPVLKKCHCANCIRVINSSVRHDEDSDDDNHHSHARFRSIDQETFNPYYGLYPQATSYRMNNNF